MSIEAEKWVMRPGEGIIRHADTGTAVQMLVPERLRACAVLPEALALLKQYIDEEGIDENSVRDLLRRAGVMK